MLGQWKAANPQSTYRQPESANIPVSISCPPHTFDRPPSFNHYCGGSVSYTAMKCIALFPNWVLHSQSFQYVLICNFTNMHAMSHRSDFVAGSATVNIQEPAFCCTITLLSAVTEVRFPIFLTLPAMLDSESLNTSMLEVMITSKNERVCIHDLSDLTVQMVFDTWWASMNIRSKVPPALNNSSHSSSWQFYLQCRFEETGSPGIICIVCYQALCHPSEHGTSTMGRHLLAKAHIAM